jgi:perosamine synthetase
MGMDAAIATRPEIAHNKPWVLREDIEAVSSSLATGWLAPGPEVAAIEREVVGFQGGGAACAVSSGTAALLLALKGAGITRGDRVAISTYVCSAVLNAVIACEATPVLVDINRSDFNIDPRSFLGLKDRPKAVIAVHTYGAAISVDALRKHADVVIEDCCQSIGGDADGAALGRRGDAAVFSFYATKIVTGGHGGMVYAAGGDIPDFVRDYINFDGRNDWKPRFNYQMTDFQAALIRKQFGRLGTIKHRRRSLAVEYRAALPPGYSVQAGVESTGAMPYRFVIIAPDQHARDRLQRHFDSFAIRTIVPLERKELLHRLLGLSPAQFENAEQVVATTLSIPLYPALSEDDAARIVEALQKAPAP